MVRDNRHDTAYLFGAICPARGVGAAMITPAANTECMNLHLDEISTQVTPGARRAIVRWRRLASARRGTRTAGQHRHDNIAALPPELNPMENVWAYLRANKLCAMVWDSYDDIVEACKECLDFPRQRPWPHPLHWHS